jgi:hypothetical protein
VIYDQAGAVVNRFSSNDLPKPLDLSKLPVAPEWAQPVQPPAASPGHHRFVWDLHYAKPAVFTEARATGVWAPPGRYTVELDAGGQALRQPLTILADPRVKVSGTEFAAQFRLAREVENERVRVQTMLKRGSEIKAELAKLTEQADIAALNSQYDALVGPAAPMQGTNAPNSLTGISSWLDKLESAVDGSDGAPSPDMLHGFADVSAALDAIEPRWNAFVIAAQSRIPAKQTVR